LRNWTAVEWLSHANADPSDLLALGNSERLSGRPERNRRSTKGGEGYR
jgi:hypothetical protein